MSGTVRHEGAEAPPAAHEAESAAAREDGVLALSDPAAALPGARGQEHLDPHATPAQELDHSPAEQLDEPTTVVVAQADEADEATTLVLAASVDDEVTTFLPAQRPHDADEATTLVLADGQEKDEATTLVAASEYGADRSSTVVRAAADGSDDETTSIVPAPEPGPSGAVQAAPAAPTLPGGRQAMDESVTEIRHAALPGNPGQGAPDWFTDHLHGFTQALRMDSTGAARPAQEVQQLALTARDMIARVAMQGGARSTADGWTGDTVLQPDQLLANTYIVRSLIARGGIGEIYRTRHRDLKTEHAVKVLLPRYALDPTVLTLLQDEARLLACVRHEAVVRCQDLLRDADGRPMLVMDFLRGRTLSARLREGRLDTPELIVLARRLAEGLTAIHAAGIIHQDISPDNVILADDSCGAATIIDFGLARRVGTGRDMHRNLDFAGKYSWSSPEQLSGRPAAVDARSDLYSLGLMLAAAARGYRLDMGQDLESARAARTTVPSLAGIEQPLAGLIEALLAPSPDARLGSATDIEPMLETRPRSFWERIAPYLGLR